jgi:phage-related minor tail protein
MNYEWEIQKLDLQLKHVREMQAIYKERVNAHEQGLEYTGNRLNRIEADLENLTGNINKLVTALMREHSNGKPGGEEPK